MRTSIALLLAAAILAGCDNPNSTTAEYEGRFAAAPPSTTTDAAPAGGVSRGVGLQQAQTGESYIYDHALTISMASKHIKARFERARDRCQNDTALKCKIMSASFQVLGNPDAPLPVAYLSVALPHESIAAFETGLVAPLPDEDAADVVVQSRSTTAQNVTNQVVDLDRRLTQLADYRERMTALAKRGNSSTDDLIKIEAEISKTQGEIEQIETQKRDLAQRIAKENINISFQAQSTASDAMQPVRDVWQSALRILGQSTAGVLMLIIGILPWIPVIVLFYFLFRWLWRRARRKPA